jgi:hypothetical protein
MQFNGTSVLDRPEAAGARAGYGLSLWGVTTALGASDMPGSHPDLAPAAEIDVLARWAVQGIERIGSIEALHVRDRRTRELDLKRARGELTRRELAEWRALWPRKRHATALGLAFALWCAYRRIGIYEREAPAGGAATRVVLGALFGGAA